MTFIVKQSKLLFCCSFRQLDQGRRGSGKWSHLRKVSNVLAGSDFKLHIKLIQGHALIKARAGNSYGFSNSLSGQHRKAINVLLLTQADSFQKISHQWPFPLCLGLSFLVTVPDLTQMQASSQSNKYFSNLALTLNSWSTRKTHISIHLPTISKKSTCFSMFVLPDTKVISTNCWVKSNKMQLILRINLTSSISDRKMASN